jgi:transformation/transcription domain-associated protein
MSVTNSSHALGFVKVLGDPQAKDELRLKAAQELTEQFETIVHCPGYKNFLEQTMKIFIKILQEDNISFISEYNIQQVVFSTN